MTTLHQVAVSFGLAVAVGACSGKLVAGGDNDGAVVDAVPAIDAVPEIDAPPPPPIPADCLDAANRGLTWLVAQQAANGSWGSAHPVAATGFAVLKLETYAAEIGQSPFSPNFVYSHQVAIGLDFLFSKARRVPITAQLAGNPDSNANGTALEFSTLMYENAISLMAIAAGAEPDRIVPTPGSAVVGLTFKAVADDAIDYFSFAQSDSPASSAAACTRGGWRYAPFDHSAGPGDNSVTQFATLALEYARHPNYNFQITIPDWVTTELRDWATCIQNHAGATDGASGYTNPTSTLNAYKTGALIQQAAFLGDTTNSPNVAAALGYLGRVWASTSGNGWKAAPVSDYLAMYSIMKGMESMAITDIGGIHWYREFCDQLKAEQKPDGSWPASRYERERIGTSGLNSTEWALLVLERAAPPPEVIN